jgi:hypothetical protein
MNSQNGCRRSDGTFRAWFATRAEAVAFAKNPLNPAYHGDVPVLCARCNFYHLNRPEWLEPKLSHRDAAVLESMGIEGPARMDEYFRCTVCGIVMREGIEFFITPTGNIRCSEKCGRTR